MTRLDIPDWHVLMVLTYGGHEARMHGLGLAAWGLHGIAQLRLQAVTMRAEVVVVAENTPRSGSAQRKSARALP